MAQVIGAPSTGSIRADTFSRNRYGAYIRNRSIPINPNTPAQTTARNRFRSLAQMWQERSASQQAAWANYAELHPRLNKLGETIILAGSAMYMSVNATRLAAGFSISSTVPGTPEGIATDVTVVAELDTTGPTRTLTISGIDQEAGNVVILRGGPPVSKGRVTPVRMTQFGVKSTAAWATPVSILTDYNMISNSWGLDSRLLFEFVLVDSLGNVTNVSRVNADVVDTTP